MLTSRGLGAVLGDLASMGFDAKWGVLGANDIGANHQRDRIWIRAEQMGNTHNNGQTTSKVCPSFIQGSDRSSTQQEQTCQPERSGEQYAELAYPERMGWEERPSERGEPENQETPNQSDYCGETSGERETIANSECTRLERREDCGKQEVSWTRSGGSPIGHADWWSTEPNVGRVAHGVPQGWSELNPLETGKSHSVQLPHGES